MFETTVLEILEAAEDSPFNAAHRPVHPPICGPDGQYFGHEWSRWRYDTLDQRVDEVLGRSTGEAMRILDVGCATGCKAAHFARAGHQVTAVDIVDCSRPIEARNHDLRRHAADARSLMPIVFLQADIRRIQASQLTGTFDLIHARRVVNFITAQDLNGFFGMIRSALADGGFFAASFIANEIRQAGEMTHVSLPGGKPPLSFCPGLYVHHFSEVHHALREHGLAIAEGFSDGQIEAGLIARAAAP